VGRVLQAVVGLLQTARVHHQVVVLHLGSGGGGRRSVVAHLLHEAPDLEQPGVLLLVDAARRTAGDGADSGAVVRLVLLDVPVQVGLLREPPVAQITLEVALLSVYVAHVPLEVGGYAERPFAVRAPVRLFAGVRTHVPGQVGAARENLATVLARVPVLGLDVLLLLLLLLLPVLVLVLSVLVLVLSVMVLMLLDDVLVRFRVVGHGLTEKVFNGRRRTGHERKRPGGGRPERLMRLHVLQLALCKPGQRRGIHRVQVQRFGVGHQVADRVR